MVPTAWLNTSSPIKMGNTDGIPVLSQGVGYGIVVGIGGFFALLMYHPLPHNPANHPLTTQASNNIPPKPLYQLLNPSGRRIQHRLPQRQARANRSWYCLLLDLVRHASHKLNICLQLWNLRAHVVRRNGNLANPPLRPHRH